jgi:hypothetical protein
MFHTFLVHIAARQISNYGIPDTEAGIPAEYAIGRRLDTSRMAFLHLGIRAEMEDIFQSEEGPTVKFFSAEDELWLQRFIFQQSNRSQFDFDRLASTSSGHLVLERFRVSADYCPCEFNHWQRTCLRHFLAIAAARINESLKKSWFHAGSMAATYFGSRLHNFSKDDLKPLDMP